MRLHQIRTTNKKIMNNDNNNLILAERITEECERRNINLCGNFEDWTKVAMSLADLGEAARELFHRLARLDDKYKERECDGKYSNVLRTKNRTTFGSFIYLAKQHGIDVGALRKQHGIISLPYKPIQRIVKPQQVRPIDFIPMEHISILERRERSTDNLFNFLAEYFPADRINQVFHLYHVGTTKDRMTVFPQIDVQGRCRSAKVIRYKADGHRSHKYGDTTWLHSLEKGSGLIKGFNLQQCLFGEHLTVNNNKMVILVEAPKTAVIGEIVYPGKYVWLATDVKCNFRSEMLAQIEKRDVMVFPDVDGAEYWTKKLHELKNDKNGNRYKHFAICEWWKEAKAEGNDDIADFIMREVKKDKEPYTIPDIVKRLFPGNDAVNYLCESLQLEPIE